jgi:hypothetical protein
MGMLATIDWSSFTTGVSGAIPDITALAAGVVGAVITGAVVVKGVKFATSKVTSFLR